MNWKKEIKLESSIIDRIESALVTNKKFKTEIIESALSDSPIHFPPLSDHQLMNLLTSIECALEIIESAGQLTSSAFSAKLIILINRTYSISEEMRERCTLNKPGVVIPQSSDVCVLIGASKTGKSTLTNILHDMKCFSVAGDITCPNAVAKVSSSLESETILPNIGLTDYGLLVIDTPGVTENRSMIGKACISLILGETLRLLKEYKLVIVLSESALSPGAGNAAEIMMHIHDALGPEVLLLAQGCEDSCCIVMTRATSSSTNVSSKLSLQLSNAASTTSFSSLRSAPTMAENMSRLIGSIKKNSIFCLSPADCDGPYIPEKVRDLTPATSESIMEFMSKGGKIIDSRCNLSLSVPSLYLVAIRSIAASNFEYQIQLLDEKLAALISELVLDLSPTRVATLSSSKDNWEIAEKTYLDKIESLSLYVDVVRGLEGDLEYADKATEFILSVCEHGLVTSWYGIAGSDPTRAKISVKKALLSDVGKRCQHTILSFKEKMNDIDSRLKKLRSIVISSTVGYNSLGKALTSLSCVLGVDLKKASERVFLTTSGSPIVTEIASASNNSKSKVAIQALSKGYRSYSGFTSLFLRLYDKGLQCGDLNMKSFMNVDSTGSNVSKAIAELLDRPAMDCYELLRLMHDPCLEGLSECFIPTVKLVCYKMTRGKFLTNQQTMHTCAEPVFETAFNNNDFIFQLLGQFAKGHMFDANDELTYNILSRYSLYWMMAKWGANMSHSFRAFPVGSASVFNSQVRFLVVENDQSTGILSEFSPVGWMKVSDDGSLVLDKESHTMFSINTTGKESFGSDQYYCANFAVTSCEGKCHDSRLSLDRKQKRLKVASGCPPNTDFEFFLIPSNYADTSYGNEEHIKYFSLAKLSDDGSKGGKKVPKQIVVHRLEGFSVSKKIFSFLPSMSSSYRILILSASTEGDDTISDYLKVGSSKGVVLIKGDNSLQTFDTAVNTLLKGVSTRATPAEEIDVKSTSMGSAEDIERYMIKVTSP